MVSNPIGEFFGDVIRIFTVCILNLLYLTGVTFDVANQTSLPCSLYNAATLILGLYCNSLADQMYACMGVHLCSCATK